tara:strand:+ start:1089 stop:1373 length:285 start_codon:yes stop_codon:yes gene_type:complete
MTNVIFDMPNGKKTVKLATLTMTQMRDLMYKKEATATEIFDALIKEMRERKTKTSAQKVMRFVRSFSNSWQHITDEDIALFEEIRISNRSSSKG